MPFPCPFVLIGHDNIDGVFLMQARQNANHAFIKRQRGLGECIHYHSPLYFLPQKVINALMYSPWLAAQNI